MFASAPNLTPKKTPIGGILLLIMGLVVCIGGAAYSIVESRRTETIIIAARPIPYGQQIVADDLATIELPLHRPIQLAGVQDPRQIIGQYANRPIGTNDVISLASDPPQLIATPPPTPVYANGRILHPNMVPFPFDITNVGTVTDRDTLNIGFNAADATLCDRLIADVALGSTVALPIARPPAIDANAAAIVPRSYACRWMGSVPILTIADSIAYLEVTPAQALALRALQADAKTQLWAERYGSTSAPLRFMDRLDAAQVTIPNLTDPVTDTIAIEPRRVITDTAALGTLAPIPGAGAPAPGAAVPAPTAAPTTPAPTAAPTRTP